jgi:hypothetical protein
MMGRTHLDGFGAHLAHDYEWYTRFSGELRGIF